MSRKMLYAEFYLSLDLGGIYDVHAIIQNGITKKIQADDVAKATRAIAEFTARNISLPHDGITANGAPGWYGARWILALDNRYVHGDLRVQASIFLAEPIPSNADATPSADQPETDPQPEPQGKPRKRTRKWVPTGKWQWTAATLSILALAYCGLVAIDKAPAWFSLLENKGLEKAAETEMTPFQSAWLDMKKGHYVKAQNTLLAMDSLGVQETYLLGILYQQLEDFESATKYLNRTLADYERFQDQQGIHRTRNELANILLGSGNIEQAQEQFLALEAELSKTTDYRTLGTVYLRLALSAIAKENFDESVIWARKCHTSRVDGNTGALSVAESESTLALTLILSGTPDNIPQGAQHALNAELASVQLGSGRLYKHNKFNMALIAMLENSVLSNSLLNLAQTEPTLNKPSLNKKITDIALRRIKEIKNDDSGY